MFVSCTHALARAHTTPQGPQYVVSAFPRLSLIADVVYGASWAGILFFDCMILSLTVWKAFVSYRKRGGRLLSTLVRDGESFRNLNLLVTAVDGV